MRWTGWLAAALLGVCLGGCTSVSLDVPYYWQSIRGHWNLLRAATPIDEVLARPDLDPALRERLRLVQSIRRYASEHLGLPDNGSYTRYADLHRPFALWNVFAAPEFSLELKRWCFPVAGCVGYRGYYAQADAQAYAEQLRAQGLDVYVAGIPAYSTLGWFDDPVLNTFINYPPPELARLIFHELAHQLLYVKGDTTFNESFATTVEEIGVLRWLDDRGDPAMRSSYLQYNERRRQFVALLTRYRDRLADLYKSAQTDDERRAAKASVFEALQRDYQALKADWGGYSGYDRWFGQKLNNAQLGSVSSYTQFGPAFMRLYHASGDDLPAFFHRVREIAAMDKAERDGLLAPK